MKTDLSVPESEDGEFQRIRKFFSPLTSNCPGAFNLENDAAVLSLTEGHEQVLTMDTMVEGVHFLPDCSPDLIAKKLLRTNISDIAAMGGKPVAYLLSTGWSSNCDVNWIGQFAKGLEEDQAEFGISLLGGDTVKTKGPSVFSITLLGEVPSGKAFIRGGAKSGDLVCVSGAIGDAAFGLKVAKGELSCAEQDFLRERYELPTPRVELGCALQDLEVTACLDVSDGLAADLQHICETSKVGAEVRISSIPCSSAAKGLANEEVDFWQTVLSGGDDYELLFTIKPSQKEKLVLLSESTKTPISVIGRIKDGDEMKFVDQQGDAVALDNLGWRHF